MGASEITHAPDITRKGLTGINDTSPKYKVIIIDGMEIANAIPETENIMYAMILHKSFLTSSATWLAITLKEQMRTTGQKGNQYLSMSWKLH